jgi:serine/threonine-protein kinase
MSQTPNPAAKPRAMPLPVDSPQRPVEVPAQARIDALLDEWERTCEAGQPANVETICQDHPELVQEVRRRVAALEVVDRKLDARKKKKKQRAKLEPLQVESTIDGLEFLNAGGLGEVFVGEDDTLHRRVAVKFMHARLSQEPERRSQFALEAEITGRLEHPGVVPLYGFGCTHDNRPFYAMRFIEGETLDDKIKSHFKRRETAHEKHSARTQHATSNSELALEFRGLLGHFVSVCKTIAYAHNRGVVHRDIKPSNIMIGRFGETIVVDWGLAVSVMRDERFRVSGEETLALSPSGSQSGSSSGRGAGTPAFMSPEQFSELAPTPASDIYSLGATLFVLLCGQPPVRHKSISEIRDDTLQGKLPDLNEIRRHIPRQLQSIAYKAMQKEARDRYPTALDLARDVERYLADEPVSAHQDSFGLRLARIARRHRSAAQAIVLGLLTCLLIAGLSAIRIGSHHRTAESLRLRNLTTSAQFIARACGYEIDRVWRVLEFEASSPQLHELVLAANTQLGAGELPTVANQAELHQWLQGRLEANAGIPTIESLFVLSRGGTQVARVPIPTQSQVGENFARRDYYTGLGFDLDPDRDADLIKLINEPLVGPRVYPSGVHLSAPYLSTLKDEQHLKVTFTVPIRAPNSSGQTETIGVLGTSAEVGNVMRATQINDSNTWIADLREDTIQSRRKRGLLIHYPIRQPTTAVAGEGEQADQAKRLSNDLVESLLEGSGNYDKVLDETWLQGLSDHYSIQPVVISGRSETPFDLGWVVITAESMP